MKIVGIFVLTMFVCLPLYAQKAKKRKAINETKQITMQLMLMKEANKALQKTLASHDVRIEQLNKQLNDVKTEVANVSNSTDRSFAAGYLEDRRISDRVEELGSKINRNMLFVVLFGLALALGGVGGFLYANKRIVAFSAPMAIDFENGKFGNDLATNLADSNRRDSELLDFLKSTFLLLQEKAGNDRATSDDIDHKLPLKIGDEIHRMRKRIENMPQEIKGLNALRNSLTRLEEEFNEKGYQIVNLIGKNYNDGMHVEARFVDDPSIPPGAEIITDVLRPQINFRDKVIQAARVEVGKSY